MFCIRQQCDCVCVLITAEQGGDVTVSQFKLAARTGMFVLLCMITDIVSMCHTVMCMSVSRVTAVMYMSVCRVTECLSASQPSLLCLELSYMSSLLQDGFGFKDSDVTRVSLISMP